MIPFVVAGTIHEAESVIEDPFTLERVKLTGADGTIVTVVNHSYKVANALTIFISNCYLRIR